MTMIEPTERLITALRNELQQYGELLALLDQQQEFVTARQADDLLGSISAIQAQGESIRIAREQREQVLREIAQLAGRPGLQTFQELMPVFPPDYRPLVEALVQENNELLRRVQQHAGQNHLLIRRSMELMQKLINSLIPSPQTVLYTGQGTTNCAGPGGHVLYEAVG